MRELMPEHDAAYRKAVECYLGADEEILEACLRAVSRPGT